VNRPSSSVISLVTDGVPWCSPGGVVPTYARDYHPSPSRKASPPFGRYQTILLGGRGTQPVRNRYAASPPGRESNPLSSFGYKSETLNPFRHHASYHSIDVTCRQMHASSAYRNITGTNEYNRIFATTL